MDELQRLQGLLDQLLGTLETVLASGEPLSDEMQGLIAEQLKWLHNRIQELSNIISDPTNKLKFSRPFPSSNVHSFGYDNKNGRLYVRFQGDFPNQDGPVYSYEGVPQNIFEIFKRGAIPARTTGRNAWGEWWKGKVPSLGASLYALIKQGNYPYQRLS